MIIEFNNDIPIYIQVAQAIEDSIIKGIFKEDEIDTINYRDISEI